jgi:DNA polymerase sigma
MFSIESEKVDVTASNDTAIINSEFLSHFSKIREVGLLCILIKMWAKNRNVIKKISPMKGLSAYGVIMMCLFFLMETKQINFL